MSSKNIYKAFALRAATVRALQCLGLWRAGLSLTVARQQDGDGLHGIPVLQLADEAPARLAAGRPDAQHRRPQDAPASCRQQHLLILSAILHAHLHKQASANSHAHERLEALTSSIQDAPPCCRGASVTLHAVQCASLRGTETSVCASKLKGCAARILAPRHKVLQWQTHQEHHKAQRPKQ